MKLAANWRHKAMPASSVFSHDRAIEAQLTHGGVVADNGWRDGAHE